MYRRLYGKHNKEFTHTEVKDLSDSVLTQGKSIKEATASLNTLDITHTDSLKKMDYMENQTRRNNIRIEGMREDPGETWDKTEAAVRDLLSKKLGLDGPAVEIERAHRVGKRPTAYDSSATEEASPRHRSICVKLLRYKDKTAILKNAKKLKQTGIYINEDLSDMIMARRREQMPNLRAARESGK